MNNKFMRIMVFFDLPTLTDKDRKEYNNFHKFLIKHGFIMMQKSVYTKLVINNVSSVAVKKLVYEHAPTKGTVEMLEITENQFLKIEYIVGENQTTVVDSMERLIEI